MSRVRIRMGTTVRHHCAAGGKGVKRSRRSFSEGMLHIGAQSRPHVFDLRIYTTEDTCAMRLVLTSEQPSRCIIHVYPCVSWYLQSLAERVHSQEPLRMTLELEKANRLIFYPITVKANKEAAAKVCCLSVLFRGSLSCSVSSLSTKTYLKKTNILFSYPIRERPTRRLRQR